MIVYFIELFLNFLQNWKEMNYKCCDGSLIRFLLSAPVRLSVFLVLGKYRPLTASDFIILSCSILKSD